MAKTIIYIDIDDWVDEWGESPVKPHTRDDIIAAMQETNIGPTKAARLAIAGREKGEAEDDILKPNKVNLMLGAAHEISQMIAQRKVDVKIGDKTYEARQYIGSLAAEDDDDDSDTEKEPLVEITDSRAVERARQYLLRKATGHIWSRFLILATNKEDVQTVAEQLKHEIDAMVQRLM